MVQTSFSDFLYGISITPTGLRCHLDGSHPHVIFDSVWGVNFGSFFQIRHLPMDCVPVYVSDHREPLLKVLQISGSESPFSMLALK